MGYRLSKPVDVEFVRSMMWAAFGILMVVMLAIDLGMNRKAHEVSFRQALTWSIIWVSLAMLFNAGIYALLGKTKALEFLTGYIIEKTLCVIPEKIKRISSFCTLEFENIMDGFLNTNAINEINSVFSFN